MDLNLIRSLVTVAALAAFLGIVWWAYSPARKKRLEDAGRSVLEESDHEDEVLVTYNNITGDHVVILENYNMAGRWWPHSPKPSYWLVSLESGEKYFLKAENNFPLMNFSFSPTGRWLVFWDSEKEDYISFDTRLNKWANITKRIALVSREKDNIIDFANAIYPHPVDDIIGWYPEDSCLLIYDRYDVWKVDPSGLASSIDMTNGYGKRNKIKLRLARSSVDRVINNIFIENKPVLLTGFSVRNKYNGFYETYLNRPRDPKCLTMGPYTYYRVNSQKGHFYCFDNGMVPIRAGDESSRFWIIKRQSNTEFPNYYLTSDFKDFKALTSFQPQKNINWLTGELITYKQLDGTLAQGVIYKPENFDKHKKYPVIFNFYEKLSHQLYEFPYPGLTSDNINIPWFISKGYLVFTPDIHYTIANKSGMVVGDAVFNSIQAAAFHLSTLPFIDSKKMGIQGHSFGGGEIYSLVVRSRLFSAACAAAPTVSDQISAYLGVNRTDGRVIKQFRLNHSESGHDMIGATLWDKPDLFIKASPVFKIHKITTPLLIMHNKEDRSCDWSQSVEMYMGLRRLGKKCWMLQYDGEDHSLSRKSALDFTIKLTQYFDHFLKDGEAPNWMSSSYKNF